MFINSFYAFIKRETRDGGGIERGREGGRERGEGGDKEFNGERKCSKGRKNLFLFHPVREIGRERGGRER